MTAEQYREKLDERSTSRAASGLIFQAGIGEGAAFFTVTVWGRAPPTTRSRPCSHKR